MSRKSDIIKNIQTLADGSTNDMIAAIGTPGGKIKIGEGDSEVEVNKGNGWSPLPSAFTFIIEGIAQYLDTFKAEIMEEVEALIDEKLP